MHILWKLKSVRKEVMAEITEDQPHYNTLSTIVRNLEKGYVAHNAYGKRINTTPSLLSRTTEKGL
jgi:predicted transcriptional regulator